MELIEFDRWRPSVDNPRKLEYVGQRTAQEVCEELKHRLEGQGYLPDEYFLLRDKWQNGREIPRDADLFCTVDYGESEGVYVDVYLKWYDEKRQKSVTESFIVGKTLGENGNDLDRMFLTASAITKAVHGDHATLVGTSSTSLAPPLAAGLAHFAAPPLPTKPKGGFAGPPSKPSAAGSMGKGGARERAQFSPQAETELSGLCDDAGQRPLYLSDYDKAVLAIRDGELPAFLELYPKVLDAHAGDLLIEAAGRPGAVGRQMTRALLDDVERFPESAYAAACKRAIDINDPQKVEFLLANAADRVADLSPSFHGGMASYAYLEHRHISREIIKQCSDEQIAAAPPLLLELFAQDADFHTLSVLVEKGISGGDSAARTLHMLTYEGRNSWMAETLLEKGMWVAPTDYGALHACVENGAVGAAKLLLDGGMDLEQYKEWAKRQSYGLRCNDTLASLEEHWAELQAQNRQLREEGQGEEQPPAEPGMGGMTIG